MDCRVPIINNVHWIGVNDRETTLFENFWPLDKGVAYNSYLINDEKVALVDTVKFNKTEQYLAKIREIIGDRKVDYLIVNHMEPDHSGSMQAVIAAYPDIQIVGNKKTFEFINNFYGITKNWLEIKEGDELDLGYHKLTFFITPMIHWPETMMTYDKTDKLLFSMDAFGGFGALDGGMFDDEVNIEVYEDEIRRYYSNIVATYSPIVQRALKRLADLEIRMILSTHGPIWRTCPGTIVDYYDKWSRYEAEEGVVIVYSTMYGNTAKMADFLARVISENGVKNVRVYDASKTHLSYIISDIWRFKGLCWAPAPTTPICSRPWSPWSTRSSTAASRTAIWASSAANPGAAAASTTWTPLRSGSSGRSWAPRWRPPARPRSRSSTGCWRLAEPWPKRSATTRSSSRRSRPWSANSQVSWRTVRRNTAGRW